MKKMKIIAVLGAAAIAVLIAGTAVANFQSDTVKASQNLDMKSLSVGIDVEQDFEGMTAFPGQQLVESLNVENTADTDVYVRVVIKGYLTNEDGEKIFGYFPEYESQVVRGTMDHELKAVKLPILDVDLGEALAKGWIVSSQDNEETVLYYTQPIAAGDTTPNVFSSVTLAKEMGNEFEGMGMTVSVKTEAIQASLAEQAMLAEWGVLPTIDENGVITEISE